jgi:hypothetical protein
MTVKLELKPEIEANLIAQARARGLSLESYLDQLLQSAAIERDVFATQAQRHDRPKNKKSLAQLFADSPFKGLDLDFERDADTGRPVTL